MVITRGPGQEAIPVPDQSATSPGPQLVIQQPTRHRWRFRVQPLGRCYATIDCRPIIRLLQFKAIVAIPGDLVIRWLRFNAVGAIGIIVQLSALAIFVRALKLPVAVGTGLAVETAIIHNFIWHRGWTWSDRKGSGRGSEVVETLRALLRFNFTTGLISLLGNMFLMHLLAGRAGLGLLKANLMTIAICSLLNFIVSDRFVFVTQK